jgi:hypothetical protein
LPVLVTSAALVVVATTAAVAVTTGGSQAETRRAAPAAAQPHRPAAAWSSPDAAAITMLRRVIIAQSSQGIAGLRRCTTRLGGAPHATRAARYVRCALPSLAQLGSAGPLNATLLLTIANAHPSKPCDALIRSLAGTSATAGMVARTSLRNELSTRTAWRDIAATTRAIVSLAREDRRLARDTRWRHACRATAVRPTGVAAHRVRGAHERPRPAVG